MRKAIPVAFSKLHGLGNDFILADAQGLPKSLPALARAITNRHCGVGADGFIAVYPPRHRNNQARIRFYNADGSEPEMSGNGIRCAAGFLVAGKRIGRIAKLETISGVKTLHLLSASPYRWTFRVQMGAPILEPSKIPFIGAGSKVPVTRFPLDTASGRHEVTVTSMGNPHCSLIVKDFSTIDWPAIGREIERSKHFPKRTNVEFVRRISRREIEVRFWERGVGVTNSSGTGSCGAVAACILNGLTDRTVCVRTLAGNLEIEWKDGGEIFLTGPVELIATGTYIHNSE